MYDASLSDRYADWSVWGRFALALVSARAGKCPQMHCRRKKRCLARLGPQDNLHTEAGSCPIMSGVEWRCVSLGIRGNWSLLGPWQAAQRDRAEAEEDARDKAEGLSREERRRRWQSPEHIAMRREEERRWLSGPGREYALMLWLRAKGDDLYFPRDVAASGERLIAWRRKHGCRCAKAGRLECADAEECVRRVGEGGAEVAKVEIANTE